MHSFEELEVWKKSRTLRNDITKLVRKFPNDEKYRLTDQLIRASRSVTANIAEGFGRYHHQENIQFCRLSRGSLFEIKDHLTVALDEGYINTSELAVYNNQIQHCLKILNGYISYLKKAKLMQANN